VPEIHVALVARGVAICERSVTNLVDRYDELLATALGDSARLRKEVTAQGRVVLALDGLQPDVGHKVLWVLRECLSSQVLLALSLLSQPEATTRSRQPELVAGGAKGGRGAQHR
jgi:hypothetical protein